MPRLTDEQIPVLQEILSLTIKKKSRRIKMEPYNPITNQNNQEDDQNEGQEDDQMGQIDQMPVYPDEDEIIEDEDYEEPGEEADQALGGDQ